MGKTPTWKGQKTATEALWQEVCALDKGALHAAIAEQCYGWRHIPWAIVRSGTGCTHQAPDGGYYCLEPYTEDWHLTMDLSRLYHVWSEPNDAGWSKETGIQYDGWRVRCEGLREAILADSLLVHTEQEERVARCRLALFRARLENDPTSYAA